MDQKVSPENKESKVTLTLDSGGYLLKRHRPIMALIAGTQAPRNTVMGHAGALYHNASEGAALKFKELKDLGVVMTNHPSKFGAGMQALLSSSRSPLSLRRPLGGGTERFMLSQKSYSSKEQRRSIHTGTRRPCLAALARSQLLMCRTSRRDSHLLSNPQSLEMLKAHGVTVGPNFHSALNQHINIQIKIERHSGELYAILDGLEETWKDLEHMPLDQLNPHGLPPGTNSQLIPGQREIPLRAVLPNIEADAPPHFFFGGGPTLFYNTCKPVELLSDPCSYVARLAQLLYRERIFYISARISRDKKCDDPKRFPAWDLTDASIGVDNLVYDGPKAKTSSTQISQGEQTVSDPRNDAAKDGIVFVKFVPP